MDALRFNEWLAIFRVRGINSIAMLFALTTVVRALLITLIPLRALEHMGNDAQALSVLYFCVSVAAVAGNLCVPLLIHWLRRRWVFLLGLLLQISATPFLWSDHTAVFIAGMILQVIGVATSDLTLNVFLLDHVPRRDLARVEPLRMFYAGTGWTLGPWVGVYLWEHVSWLPFASSAAGAVLVGCYFWDLGFTEVPVRSKMTSAPNPFQFLPRYFSQPRLVLAWFLAVGRNSWWVVFYYYGPVYMVSCGAEESTTALVVSVANGGIFLVRIWGWVGRRYGIRRLLYWGYGLMSGLTLLVTAVPSVPWVVAALLFSAAMAAAVVDGAGNVPFLRAVRSFERPGMTSVFMTYRDTAQLVPPGVFAVLLRVMELQAVFAITAASLLVLIRYIKFVPRRL